MSENFKKGRSPNERVEKGKSFQQLSDEYSEKPNSNQQQQNADATIKSEKLRFKNADDLYE